MKKYIFIFTLLVLSSCKTSQTSQNKGNNALNLSNYINSITSAELQSHLTIVASDDMQGRETGSEGQKKAGKYLIEQ